MYGCKFHQYKERKVVTRNFEFMVEIEFTVEKLCGPLKAASWPTAHRLKTSELDR